MLADPSRLSIRILYSHPVPRAIGIYVYPGSIHPKANESECLQSLVDYLYAYSIHTPGDGFVYIVDAGK